MAEIAGVVVSVVQFVSQCLAPSSQRRINYWREFKSNSQNLKTEVERLKAESRGIQRDVDDAKRNGDGIKENVQNWLERAEKLEEDFQKWLERANKIRKDEKTAEEGEIREGEEATAARNIEGDVQTATAAGEIREDEETEAVAAKQRCFKVCLDLKARYKLSKEAETLQQAIVKHFEAGKFDKISYPVIPKDPRLSSRDYEAFESRTSTLKNVINSLSDPNVNIVGIYGMAGIGKTTLVKEVANQSETNKLFDLVIFIEVTEKPDKMKIQREIAERLGLTLSSEEAEAIRAGKLCQRLKNEKENEKKENEKKILIIFDNIWVHLDLQAIGIPLGVCKVLLTSRRIDVLEKMDSQQNFPVDLLNDEEAWHLFKKMTRDNIEGTEFESVAIEVAKKCARLPIVIVTIARALKNKELFVWKDALHQLNIPDIRASIELSFNYLENEVLKKTILLMRYSNMTSIDELLLYGMGLGIFEGINNIEARRDRVHTLVQQLKDSCLLLDSTTIGEDFSMHDIVRDVAISIANRDQHVFTNDQLFDEFEWPVENTLKVYSSIVLRNIETGELPQVLECPNLKLLSISGVDLNQNSDFVDLESDFSFKIHHEFFTKMIELKVLVLANMDLFSLPSSLRLLTNLRALGFYNCHLDDIAIVGDLKKLEILSFKGSYIKQLPGEISHLTRLKSLDLRSQSLCIIPPNVISSLSHLEELYLDEFDEWEEAELNKDRTTVSLDELKHLSNLTCLDIQIKDAKTLPRDLCFEKLKRYKIAIGSSRICDSGSDWIWNFSSPKSCRKFTLSLINTNICLMDGHIMQLKGIEDLCLVGSHDMKSVLYGIDRDGFPQLKYLQVQDNDELLSIIDSMEYVTRTSFPILESLLIKNLISLQKICRGQLTTDSFGQLKKIKVEKCNRLKNIFSFSIARRLQLLQSIDVTECKNMEGIFTIEREDEFNNNGEVTHNIELTQLRSLRLNFLPQFRSFCLKLKTSSLSQQRWDEIILDLEDNINVSYSLFTGEVALPNLEVLELEEINVVRIWQNQVAALSFGQNLKTLILCDCNTLRYLFSSSIANNFVQLQHLEISACRNLEEIVVVDEWKDVVFPKLEFLKIVFLENLSKFYSGDSIEFPSLKILEIGRCFALKEFLVKNISKDITEIPLSFFNEKVALPKLEVLVLYGTYVERIWYNLDAATTSGFQNLIRLNLSNCCNIRCLFTSSITSNFVQLQHFEISKCRAVEEVVAPERGKDVVFPQLQFLKMEDLESLSNFCSGDYIEFPSLKILEISKCPKLKIFMVKNTSSNLTESLLPFFDEKVVLPNLEILKLYQLNVERIWQYQVATVSPGNQNLASCNNLMLQSSSSMVRIFEKLQDLEIFYCDALQEIMVINDDGLGEEKRKNNVTFGISNMNNYLKMKVSGCNKLRTLFSPNIYRNFLRLKSLSVFNCGSLEVIFDLEDPNFEDKHTAEVIQLSNLDICYLPKLKHIWNKDPQKFLSFQKLKEVSIVRCDRLKNVFPASVASSLLQLERLDISSCGVEEIIFVNEGGEVKNPRFEFPRLHSLKLCDLPKFTTFFPGLYTMEWPTLKNLKVTLRLQEYIPQLLVEKVFSNLEELTVVGQSVATIWQLSEDLLCKLKYLEVEFDESVVILSLDFLQRFHSMKMLNIDGNFFGSNSKVEHGMSTKIRSLNKCYYLKHILKEQTNMDHLAHLGVEDCDYLVNLVPSSTSFRNLTNLEVYKCNRLTNIVTSSTAKSLGQLRQMRISYCHMITEIMAADEGDEAKDYEVIFSELKKLYLSDLESLISFCSVNYTIKFPSLEELTVDNCPEMKSFFEGILSTPRLHSIKQSKWSNQGYWSGDLNTTIKELYEEMYDRCGKTIEVYKNEDIASSSNVNFS